ncbi:hypothetical protein [Acidipila sp. EB88]|uniref:hypothetical protein n=1 Tax=Acidipila sp. EB88 TaxID=2305226 RepID=UPI0018F785F7|nr:hypothetical protein [Acidipila sp. EB88]
MPGEESSISTTKPRPPQNGSAAVEDSREALMRQVLASRTFAKSARLSQFFEYVCRKAIEGHSDQINEQQIGVHVFGRSPAYSATDDSIVRTQARLLRQRLEEYFEHECPGCPVVVLIPKGGYVPVFEPRTHGRPGMVLAVEPLARATPLPEAIGSPDLPTAHSNPAPVVPVQPAGQAAAGVVETVRSRSHANVPPAAALLLPSAEPRKRARQLWTGGAGGAVCAVLLLMAVIVAQPLHLWPQHPATLWSSLFATGRPVVIVPSDDGLVLSEELRRAPVTLDEYLSGTYLRGASAVKAAPGGTDGNADQLVTAAWLASHQYTSTADLALAMRLNRLPEAEAAQVETRYARRLHLQDLKSRNVILIGGIGANPWVGLFSPLLNFDVNYDWKSQQGYVINKNPQAGEQQRYSERKDTTGATSYGVLAYLPGISGEGSALLFEGSGMAGTEAAADFPFSGEAFASFLRRIVPSGGTIPYFEVLLETRSVGGDAPGPKIVAWRHIPG